MATATFSSSPSMAPISSSPSSCALRGCPLKFSSSRIGIHPTVSGMKTRSIVAEAEPSLSPSPSFGSSRPQKSKSSIKKQQVMLKFVWMDKNIGIGLDQVVPGQGTVPLSSYYFWPRKDAWEEIKTKLESKKWISRKQTILLLNQATDIINLWQQNATT